MFEIIRRLIVSGVALGVIAGNSDEITRFFDDTVSMTQQIATAGDMRSIGLMLDYELMKKGRYPKNDRFEAWLDKRFKENDLKPLIEDHWGSIYFYEAKKQKSYRLVSAGPDKILETDDDLTITGP